MFSFLFLIFISLIAHSSQNVGYGPDSAINFSGYIDVHNNERHLFYWFFESRNNPTNAPFLIWLSGGPGFSSLLALLVENGPYYLDSNLNLIINENSWNTNANVMWIDQPANTGYSYDNNGTTNIFNEEEIVQDLYEFLQKFFLQYSKYSNLDFYVTGEGYGGHYVSHLSYYILKQNENLNNNIFINLKGLAIGDGLVDPLHQYYQNAVFANDFNLVTPLLYDAMLIGRPECEASIYWCYQNGTYDQAGCVLAWDFCYTFEVEPVAFNGTNPYDYRKQCDNKDRPVLCYNFNNTIEFYNQNTTISALGANKEWIPCSALVELDLAFSGDWMKDFANDISVLLENNIRILIYNGEYDFEFNYYGTKSWMSNLTWTYQKEWNQAPDLSWSINNEIVGYNITYGGLTFLKILNAGGMVSMDVPTVGLNMIEQFTIKGGF